MFFYSKRIKHSQKNTIGRLVSLNFEKKLVDSETILIKQDLLLNSVSLEADHSKSIEINPQGFSYFERGRLYEKLGLTSKALKDYSNLIKIYQDATSYSVRGLFRFKNKNYIEAIDD